MQTGQLTIEQTPEEWLTARKPWLMCSDRYLRRALPNEHMLEWAYDSGSETRELQTTVGEYFETEFRKAQSRGGWLQIVSSYLVVGDRSVQPSILTRRPYSGFYVLTSRAIFDCFNTFTMRYWGPTNRMG